MKLALGASLAANAILLAVLILMSARNREKTTAAETTALAGTNQPSPTAVVSSNFQGLSWRQIESADYRKYLANLRAIGCPEPTIADIIRADVHSLFKQKRRIQGMSELEQSGPWSTEEETRVLLALLGSDAVEARPNTVEASPSASLPLVFRDLDPSLDPAQREAVAELRTDFIERIGGTNQDVSNPEYARRWEEAAPESDQLLRGMIGVNAFMRFQNEEK